MYVIYVNSVVKTKIKKINKKICIQKKCNK